MNRLYQDAETFWALFETAPDMILIYEATAPGRIVAANQRAVERLGYDLVELAGMTAGDLAMQREDLFGPLMLERLAKGEEVSAEVTRRRKDGQVFASEVRARLVDTGTRALVIAHERDVTKRRHAEGALREANLRLQAQLEEIRRLQSELRELAMHDELTGLFNRRYLTETAHRELARALREDYPISVVMMDIDNFKTINDTYGHRAGDEVLRALGTLLRRRARRADVCCRYGGDEFVALMPCATCETAAARAEEWRRAFQRMRIAHERHTLRATFSVGITALSRQAREVDSVLRAADSALYRSKAEGRNRVTIAPSPPLPAPLRPGQHRATRHARGAPSCGRRWARHPRKAPRTR